MASDSRHLAPGATLDKQVVLNGVLYDYRGVQLATPVSKSYLDAGKYRVTVGIKLKMNPANADWKAEHWIGAIAARSAEFEIGYQNPGVPVVAKGLSVVVTAEQPVIPVNEFPKFKVRFENVSNKDFTLYGFQHSNWTVQIKNKDTGLVQTWKHAQRAVPRMRHLVLAAGKSHEEICVLYKDLFYVPPKNIDAGVLLPGKHEVGFEIDLRESPTGREVVPEYWVGQVRTAPMEFTVGDGAAKKR